MCVRACAIARDDTKDAIRCDFRARFFIWPVFPLSPSCGSCVFVPPPANPRCAQQAVAHVRPGPVRHHDAGAWNIILYINIYNIILFYSTEGAGREILLFLCRESERECERKKEREIASLFVSLARSLSLACSLILYLSLRGAQVMDGVESVTRLRAW